MHRLHVVRRTITVRKQNGVSIDMLSTTRGLKITLGAGGIGLEIPESGFAEVRATAQRMQNMAEEMERHAPTSRKPKRIAQTS